MSPLDERGENKSLCVWTAPFPREFPRATCVVNKAPLFIQQLSKDQAQKLQRVKTPAKSQLPDPQSDVGMQIFPLFFYNMKTANVTGSPQCKCFELTLIKIPYQLQGTLQDVLLQGQTGARLLMDISRSFVPPAPVWVQAILWNLILGQRVGEVCA